MRSKKIIIIGSGLGGLVCGLLLSRKGYHVTILEKHHTPGGCLQNFKRKGVNFDTGMHYVGGMDEGQTLNTFLNYLGIFQELSLERLNKDGFDRVVLQDKEFHYPIGFEKFESRLLEDFPREKSGITHLIKSIKKNSRDTSLYNLQEAPSPETVFNNDAHQVSAASFIDSITKDPALKSVLLGLNPLFAGNAKKNSLNSYTLILNHYLESAYRFIGGSKQVADALVEKITEAGGDVFTRKEVTELRVSNGCISHVTTIDGQQYAADAIICATHPAVMLSFLPEDSIRKAFRNRIKGLSNTISYFGLYLSLRKNKIPYMNYNSYYYEDKNDVWINRATSLDKSLGKFAFFPAAEEHGQKFIRSATVINLMEFNIFEKWEKTHTGKRGAEYEELKESIALKLIEKLNKQIPGIAAEIEDYYTSSPLSLRDFTYSAEGSIYGIERDFNAPLESYLSPKTSISNLYYTGQNLKMHGFLGVCMGALLTCGEFINLSDLLKEIRSNNK